VGSNKPHNGVIWTLLYRNQTTPRSINAYLVDVADGNEATASTSLISLELVCM